MADTQIVKLVETESGMRAVFNLDDVQLDTPILGTWDKPVFFGKDIAGFLGYRYPKDALQKYVKSKHKTTLAQLMEKKVEAFHLFLRATFL